MNNGKNSITFLFREGNKAFRGTLWWCVYRSVKQRKCKKMMMKKRPEAIV